MFWIIQGLGLVAVIATIIAGFQTVKWKGMLIAAITNAVMAAVYFLCGSMLGGFLVLAALLRTLIYFLYFKFNKKPNELILVVFILAYLTISIIFWKSPIDILMILNLCVITYTSWQNSDMVSQIGKITSALLLAPYDILLKAYTLSVSELAMLIFAIVYLVIHKKQTNSKNVVKEYFNANNVFWGCKVDEKYPFMLISSSVDKSDFYNFCACCDSTKEGSVVEEARILCSQTGLKENLYIPFNDKKYDEHMYLANQLSLEYPLLFIDCWMKLRDGYNINNTKCKLANVTFRQTSDPDEVCQLYQNAYISKSKLTAKEQKIVDHIKSLNFEKDNPNGIRAFVAYYQQKPVALTVLLVNKTNVFVTKVCTLEKFRRKHIASSLMQYAIAQLRKEGSKSFMLVTDKGSVNEKFYAFNNFEEFAEGYVFDIKESQRKI